MAPIRGRPSARGTWHVPPREGLQKVVDAPTGRTGGTADPKLAGHTYSLSRNNRFYQPGSDRSVPTSLRAPGSPVPAHVEGQRQRRGE